MQLLIVFLEALIKKEYPIINTDEIIGGILMPGDGAADLPNFTLEYKGVGIGEGVEDWGAEKGKEYLITKEKTEDKLFIKY